MRAILIAMVASTVLVAAPSKGVEPIQGGYSTEPLEAAVFEVLELTFETTVFNNWLNENYSKLTSETMKGPREQLYYLIDSWVSFLYVRDKIVLPPEQDMVLQNLFSWAERLGVFGGNLIFNALKEPGAESLPPLMEVPAAYSLSLHEDTLRVDSKQGGWSVSVPYYFMIWNMNEFDAKDGPRTQLLALSTAAAAHQGVDGHSQATLMLLAGPEQDASTFEKYWKTALGFTGEEPSQDLPIERLKSVVKFDESTGLYSEITSWQGDTGPMVVFYSGINGTYQWNRVHFIDFLRSVRGESQ